MGNRDGGGETGAVDIGDTDAGDCLGGILGSRLGCGDGIDRGIVDCSDCESDGGGFSEAAGSDGIGEAVRSVVVGRRRIVEGSVSLEGDGAVGNSQAATDADRAAVDGSDGMARVFKGIVAVDVDGDQRVLIGRGSVVCDISYRGDGDRNDLGRSVAGIVGNSNGEIVGAIIICDRCIDPGTSCRVNRGCTMGWIIGNGVYATVVEPIDISGC